MKEQAGALVGGDATGEAERKDLWIEVLPGALGDGVEQRKFAGAVRLRDACRGDAVDRAEVLVVRAP